MKVFDFISGSDSLTASQQRQREILMYLIFGGLTTLVNLVCFAIFDYLFRPYSLNIYLFSQNFDMLDIINQVIDWIVAVLFAFVTNRLFVFRSKNHWGKELLAFISSRIATLVVFEVGLFAAGILIMERVFNTDREEVLLVLVGFQVTYKYIVKMLIAVFVVVSNYILSKWFIFRKNKSACVVSQESAEGEE